MNVVHKKRPTRWHRDGYIAPCGVMIIKRQPLFKAEQVAQNSYFWKNVTCEKCLKFLEVVKCDHIKKFKEV